MDSKRKDMLKPYDPKKSYWAPDGKGGFVESLLESDDGTKATVMVGHEVQSTREDMRRSYYKSNVFVRFRKKCSRPPNLDK